MEKKTIVVVGAGQGLGNHVAKRFGQEDFRVILIARNGQSLEQYRQEFVAGGIETHTYVADAEDPASLTGALQQAEDEFGTPDVLVYNVGITIPDDPDKLDGTELLRHYQADVASAYVCARQVATEAFGKKNGAIIFTGGGLALYPLAQFIPLSLDKSALRTLAYILHNELKPRGIFVGTVTVCGSVGMDSWFAPAKIAEAYWQMYNERGACEIVYEYPDMAGTAMSAQDYWTKVYELTEKYK